MDLKNMENVLGISPRLLHIISSRIGCGTFDALQHSSRFRYVSLPLKGR